MRAQSNNMVLDVPLIEDETVFFYYERNIKRGRILYSIVAIACVLVGLYALHTMVVPIFALVGVCVCFYLGITPSAKRPVAWVLTNSRYLEIYLDDSNHPPLEISILDIKDVHADRDEELGSSGVSIIADILLIFIQFIFGLIRDSVLDEHERTSEAYWRQTQKIYVTYQDETQVYIECHKEHVAQKVGSIIERIRTIHQIEPVDYPKRRSISL